MRPILEELESRLVPAVDVLTYHNDIASTGLNPAEVQLTPANVAVGSFGKLFSTPVDGQVYAQPLVVTDVSIADGPNTSPGAAGAHDVVFVATEHNSLYAIDASVIGGAVLWHRSFLDAADPNDNTLGATGIGTVASADVASNDVFPEVGITGTPVIDAGTNTLYVVAKTNETIAGVAHFVQRLHAVNLADGTDRVAPYLIADTTSDNARNTQIYVYGSGDGSVADPYNGTGNTVVQFNALHENQRGALSLVNNTVYVEWAAHGDVDPYHGWIAKWDVANLATDGLRLSGVFNTSPNGGRGGIWEGGGRLAFEADGSAFYVETSNGPAVHGNPVLNAAGFPLDGSYYEALLKVVDDPASTPTAQNVNGWGFQVVDYFIPYDQVALDDADRDFGSGGPVILPDAAGLPGHPHLLVAAGKAGKIYVVDRDNLGKFDPANDHVLNAAANGSGNNTPLVQVDGALSTGAYFNGKLYWVSGYGGYAEAYAIGSDGTLSITSQTTLTMGDLPGSVAVSANGSMGGIAWIMDRNSNQIHAYDAATLSTELWNSGQDPSGKDAVGAVVKFAVPTVANGEVYVGTTNSLVVYGLTPPASGVPDAPDLTATALSGTAINLSWTDATAPPNTAAGYAIEQSTDGTDFTSVTTAPAGATSLAIGGLTPLTTYYFRMRGFNGLGYSEYSDPPALATTDDGAAAQAPNAPSALGAAPASATAVSLTWTNNAANQTGFHLDRATDAGFTQGLITETLSATPAVFTDTTSGLAPGGTFYYRIRAFNDAGDSANSNMAAVTIPLAPPTPTDAQVTGVTTDTISLLWTDNAGTQADGYRVLRRVDNGAFTDYATLPALHAKGPYAWTDQGLTPGAAYAYHIQAFNISGYNDFTGANAITLTLSPSNLLASASDNTVSLAWDPVAGAVGYNVYRGTTSGGEDANPIATGVTATAYIDSFVENEVTYYYVVTAVNGNVNHAPPLPSESAPSSEASATPSAELPPGFSYDAADRTLTIIAAAAHNTFSFSQASTVDGEGTLHTTYTFTLNGASATFGDDQLVSAVVKGQGVSNSAVLITNDTYTGADGKMHETAESVQAGPGGGIIYKIDASGNASTFLTLTGFESSYAYVGRGDAAQLKGAVGAGIENVFVSAGSYAYEFEVGTSEFHLISGAATVYGYAVNSTGQAWHYDAAGGLDAFVASGNAFSYMSGNDTNRNSFFNVAVAFQVNYGIATHGNAIAYLIDSPGNDVFFGDRTLSYLSGTDSAGPVFNVAEGFALVYGESLAGGTDQAYNRDPAHNILSSRWLILK